MPDILWAWVIVSGVVAAFLVLDVCRVRIERWRKR